MSRHRFRYPVRLSTSRGNRTGRDEKEFGIHRGKPARFPKPSTEISAPTCGRMPTDFAAMWNRGEPYTPSRSTKAMAGNSSSFARDTKSSGREAPSRKLNADEECSSTYFNRRFLPPTSASLQGPCRRDTAPSLLHFPGDFPVRLSDVASAPRCPIHRAPTRFPTTSRLSFSTVRRTPGFACALLRNRATPALLPEAPQPPEAEAGKFASRRLFVSP